MFFSRRRGPTEPGANAASVPTLTSPVAAFFGALARAAATVGCAGAIVSAAAVFLGALDFLAGFLAVAASMTGAAAVLLAAFLAGVARLAAEAFLAGLAFLAVVVDFLVRIGRSLMGYSSLLAGGR